MTSRCPTTRQTVLPQLRAGGRSDLSAADSADLRTNLSPRRDLIADYNTTNRARAQALRKANRALMTPLGVRGAARGDLLPARATARIRRDYAALNAALRERWFPGRAAVFSDP
ncbi:hypothetical protein ERN12_15540 [Rhodobacteraceae bacterium]|nr:hypothetical protein ERN12_15540 [Paracoccaceae bacterium]